MSVSPPYIILKNALSKEYCALLAEYANFKAQIKPKRRKNDPLANVHREYGDPLMELLLGKLTPQIEAALNRPLWPTLSFYYTYQHGQQLQKHKDRSSCEWVAGLYIGSDPAFKKSHGSWPLILNIKGKPEPIHLDEGDILLFRGHEIEHWRDPFPGTWCVSAIFAYVEQAGPLAFQKYDQRKSLGRPHIGMFRWAFGCLLAKMWVGPWPNKV